MPCMGPSQGYAYEQGDKAFEEIMALLREKYNVMRMPVVPAERDAGGKLVRLGMGTGILDEKWDAAAAALKTAVREMIWADHAASF